MTPGAAQGVSSGEVAIADICPNPYQPRVRMDPVGLEELRDSIREHGLLQAIVVRRSPSGAGFEIVSGERRWRASQMVGLTTIRATVRDAVTDADMLELALVENVQRRELDPIERATAFRGLMETLELTQQEVADKVGLQRATVANHLRLLDLPEKVQEGVIRGLITMGHAKALLGLPDETAMLDLLSHAVRSDLSVRALEGLVRERGKRRAVPVSGEPKAGTPAADKGRIEPWAAEVQRRMQDHLGARVRIQDGGGKRGRIVIDYASRAELDRLCEIMAPRKEF